jgi:hypothetical protein
VIDNRGHERRSAVPRGAWLRYLKAVFWLLAIVLGVIQVSVWRHYMNPDGISYLDMGDAYWRGDWHTALNALWSPLYSWLLGLALLVLKPEPYWEATIVHLVNLVIYIGALLGFEVFWRTLLVYQREQVLKSAAHPSHLLLPEWAWWALGYSLFIWATLNLTTIQLVTPDMIVVTLVLLAATLILHMKRGSNSWLTFAVLGLVLGLGYLAKAAMFALALVFLATSLFALSSLRRAMPRVLVALLLFLLVSGPFIVALSLSQGRFTLGDSAKLNYAWHVNGVTKWVHWQGGADHGTPLHPTRQISGRPAIHEFAGPIKGTYPPWYDPSYWYEGIHPKFDFSNQIESLLSSIGLYFNLFFRQQAGLVVGVLIIFLIGQRRRLIVADLGKLWSLFITAIAAFGMYALVHIEMRYLGGFVLLLWAGLFAGSLLTLFQTSDTTTMEWKLPPIHIRQMVIYVIVAILFVLNANTAANVAELIRRAPYPLTNWQDRATHEQWQVANSLEPIGIRTGDEVAFIGYSLKVYWARLANVRVTADILAQDDSPNPPTDVEYFWTSDETVRVEALALFRELGAKAVITDRLPVGASMDGWQRIGSTRYYIYLLRQGDG